MLFYRVKMFQDFLQFVIQYWYLWTLFFALLALVVWFEGRTVVGGVVKLDAADLVNLMNHDNATVIDMRDEKTYKEGHVVGAVNIPAAEIASKTKKLQKFKTKPVAVICGNGQSSMKIAQNLKKEGFEKLYSLRGGMATWKSASLPVEKS